jgi:hypothetical protein
MAVYRLTQHGWPIGAVFVPVGTLINTTTPTDDFSKLAQGLPIPLNAMPLDLATWQEMQRQFPEHARWILTPAGLPR